MIVVTCMIPVVALAFWCSLEKHHEPTIAPICPGIDGHRPVLDVSKRCYVITASFCCLQ